MKHNPKRRLARLAATQQAHLAPTTLLAQAQRLIAWLQELQETTPYQLPQKISIVNDNDNDEVSCQMIRS